MEIKATPFEGLYELQPKVFEDHRGYFFESYNASKLIPEISKYNWVQDNEAYSEKGVLRGLHYQVGNAAQAKLVRVIEGEVQDVVVDLRPNSQSYGRSYSVVLSGKLKNQMLVPRGFAHGYLVLSKTAIFAYKCDNYYSKESEGGLIYNDPKLNIEWLLKNIDPLLSPKDLELPGIDNHIPIW